MALRKFRKDCENFAILAKISLWINFRYDSEISIAKITVHSEILNFRYASDFRYDSEISLS